MVFTHSRLRRNLDLFRACTVCLPSDPMKKRSRNSPVLLPLTHQFPRKLEPSRSVPPKPVQKRSTKGKLVKRLPYERTKNLRCTLPTPPRARTLDRHGASD